jgi:hypothetical protein
MKNYKSFINEEMMNFDTIFKTEISDVTIYGLEEFLSNGKDVDVSSSDTTVTWNLRPYIRQDRIKSLDIEISKVECQIEWSIDNGKDNYIYFDTTGNEKNWEIDSQIEFQKDGGVCPDSVEIDYNYKKITIT